MGIGIGSLHAVKRQSGYLIINRERQTYGFVGAQYHI